MKHLTVIALLLSLSCNALAADTCEGTDEQILNCHADEIKGFLRQWVRAWGDGDIEAYLQMYSSIRSPREDLDRQSWVKHRRARIGPEKKIELNLKLESMGLEDSGIFDVIFMQHYRSENYEDRVRKRLFLVREVGALKIWKEEVLP